MNQEILFAYVNYGEKAEYINNSILEKKEHYYDFIINVDNAENVNVTVDTNTIYVTEKEFNENNDAIEVRLEEIEQIDSRTLAHELFGINKYFELFSVTDIYDLGWNNSVLFRIMNLKGYSESYDSIINLKVIDQKIKLFETQRFINGSETNSNIENIIAVKTGTNTITVYKKLLDNSENIAIGILQKQNNLKIKLNSGNVTINNLPEREQNKL